MRDREKRTEESETIASRIRFDSHLRALLESAARGAAREEMDGKRRRQSYSAEPVCLASVKPRRRGGSRGEGQTDTSSLIK